MLEEINDLRNKYHQSDLNGKQVILDGMSPKLFAYLRYNTRFFLRDNQLMPDDFTGRYFIAQCGRAFGKSFMGSAWLAEKAKAGIQELAMVGPNFDDLTNTMVEAFKSHYPPNARPRYVGGNQSRIICPNGVIVKCYTSEQEIRGANLRYVWCDEVCKWNSSIDDTITKHWMTLNLTVRKAGSQFFITTTPKPFKLMKKWLKRFEDKDPNYRYIFGTIDDNDMISPDAVRALKDELEGTREGRQELEGILLSDTEGALWTQKLIDDTRKDKDYWEETFMSKEGMKKFYRRIVIGVDPSGGASSDSDMTGIVVVAVDDEMCCYVLEDATGHYTPLGWAKKIEDLYEKYDADMIVAEQNYGGAMVESNLRAHNPEARIKLVSAKQAKILRAQPAATRFEKNKAHIVGTMPELEEQMTSYTGDPRQKSPDRLDAMVYAMKELCLDKIYVHRDFRNTGNF